MPDMGMEFMFICPMGPLLPFMCTILYAAGFPWWANCCWGKELQRKCEITPSLWWHRTYTETLIILPDVTVLKQRTTWKELPDSLPSIFHSCLYSMLSQIPAWKDSQNGCAKQHFPIWTQAFWSLHSNRLNSEMQRPSKRLALEYEWLLKSLFFTCSWPGFLMASLSFPRTDTSVRSEGAAS